MGIRKNILNYLSVHGKENKYRIARALKIDVGEAAEALNVLKKEGKIEMKVGNAILLKNEKFWRVRAPWWLRKLIFNQADLVIAVSEFAAASVRKYFPHKDILAIINGVDSGFFNPAKKDKQYLKEKYGINFDKPIVAFIGTLQPRKRPDLVMKIAKSCQEMNFVFVGKNYAPWNFGAQINQLLNAQWIPAMPRQDISVFLASSDVFIFPSLNETCAAVIVEAMASGIPSLVSNSGGNGEMIQNGKDGFLIKVNESEKELFLEKLDYLMKNEKIKKEMAATARSRAINDFSWDRVAELYKKTLSDFLKMNNNCV